MRAWSLTAFGDDRQYGGNIGYLDDPRGIYRYDSSVANSKQLAVGDLVFVRSRKFLTGIAVVEKISSKPSVKVRQRCPVCNSTSIKERRKKTPPWRCSNGHSFVAPRREDVSVISYEANFETTFRGVPTGIPASALKKAALRPNDQLAIEQIDPSGLEKRLGGKDPELLAVFASAAQAISLMPDDSMDECDEGKLGEPDTTASDKRDTILLAVKMRRGQRKFRNQLKRRYGPVCLVSGCPLFEIVEAAHIWPYQGEESHHVRNGLLLRADLHTLFDLNMLGINPDTLRVHFHRDALSAGYSNLEGTTLRVTQTKRPAHGVLKARWENFRSLTDI